jgi:hypothetical protein
MLKAMAIETTMGTGSPSARRAGRKRHCPAARTAAWSSP